MFKDRSVFSRFLKKERMVKFVSVDGMMTATISESKKAEVKAFRKDLYWIEVKE